MRVLMLICAAVAVFAGSNLAVLSSPAQRAISADAPSATLRASAIGPMLSSGTDAGHEPAVTGVYLYAPRPTVPVVGRAASMPAPLRGTASWFRAAPGTAAAGPALRHALGRQWRGSTVTVCAGSCVRVTLSDFCQCYRGTKGERLIDLSDDAFARLAPLPVGVIAVSVSVPGPIVPPQTDAE